MGPWLATETQCLGFASLANRPCPASSMLEHHSSASTALPHSISPSVIDLFFFIFFNFFQHTDLLPFFLVPLLFKKKN
ncbi:hypothetical protein BDV36DRAFT_259375 [Aspergillus pseudocaelatus]|uniref:Uncharacterized protein n=1 Tax=Aspergillus pseudocaelatus TaxID=1825620 RepID=A0ABQ6WHS0_9EURO|nr:hypothetical protein BDV36DRAFT_259375 [Aspergillus pseudocaelatus]